MGILRTSPRSAAIAADEAKTPQRHVQWNDQELAAIEHKHPKNPAKQAAIRGEPKTPFVTFLPPIDNSSPIKEQLPETFSSDLQLETDESSSFSCGTATATDDDTEEGPKFRLKRRQHYRNMAARTHSDD